MLYLPWLFAPLNTGQAHFSHQDCEKWLKYQVFYAFPLETRCKVKSQLPLQRFFIYFLSCSSHFNQQSDYRSYSTSRLHRILTPYSYFIKSFTFFSKVKRSFTVFTNIQRFKYIITTILYHLEFPTVKGNLSKLITNAFSWTLS